MSDLAPIRSSAAISRLVADADANADVDADADGLDGDESDLASDEDDDRGDEDATGEFIAVAAPTFESLASAFADGEAAEAIGLDRNDNPYCRINQYDYWAAWLGGFIQSEQS